MKPLLILVLIVFFPTQQQVEREEPDLQVVKFSWAKEEQKVRMIRGAQNPGGPVTTPMGDGQDLGSRKIQIRSIEKNRGGVPDKPADNYQLRLELKNTGATDVKGLIWEFRPKAAPDDYQPKRYLCALQVKPKEKKLLEIWTPYNPVKVVSAGELNDEKDALKQGSLVINQIEYVDGSVWKKSGWNYKLPAESLQKLAEGTCSVF